MSVKSERFVATATALNCGIAKCDVCGGIMLEDERHIHISKLGSKPEEPKP